MFSLSFHWYGLTPSLRSRIKSRRTLKCCRMSAKKALSYPCILSFYPGLNIISPVSHPRVHSFGLSERTHSLAASWKGITRHTTTHNNTNTSLLLPKIISGLRVRLSHLESLKFKNMNGKERNSQKYSFDGPATTGLFVPSSQPTMK